MLPFMQCQLSQNKFQKSVSNQKPHSNKFACGFFYDLNKRLKLNAEEFYILIIQNLSYFKSVQKVIFLHNI